MQSDFLNENADAIIKDMNNRTESWLQSNGLFSDDPSHEVNNEQFRIVLDKLL